MTIRYGKYVLIICFVLLLVQGKLLGQQKDFQTWWEFSIDKRFPNGIGLSGELEQRFRNNSLQYDRSLITVAGDYKVNDYFGVAAGARVILASSRELQMNAKYRLHMDAIGRYSLPWLDMSLRLRFQYGFEDIFYPSFMGNNNFGNRNRLKVAHHIFGTRFELFGTVESWHLLNDQQSRVFYKMRYSLGAQYALNFSSQLIVRYILEDELNVVNPMQSHILLFGYSYSL